MLKALLKNEKSLLNRGSAGYLRIYYEITDSLFSLDNLAKRDENSTETPNPEKEDETPKEDSIFGSDNKLASYKDFSDYHLKWVKEILAGHDSILFHVRTAAGE